MPTVLHKDGYRFFFYPLDVANEPPHVHVRKGGSESKFWLDPVRPARNIGFRPHELVQIERLVKRHHDYLIDCWLEEKEKQ